MNAGAYMISLYCTPSTVDLQQNTEGEADSRGVIQSLVFDHPGSEVEIEEFLLNWNNRNIGAIVQYCSTGRKRQAGTLCAPLQLEAASQDNKDANKSTITLKSSQKSPYRIAEYEGTMTLDTVKGTAPANATYVDVDNGEGEYQLTDGSSSSATITTLANAVDGKVYTLLGSGGSWPSTITGDDFVLKSGTAWNASAGATITFRAFKDGASSFKYFEQSRT